MTRRIGAVTLARALAALFFVATALYGVVAFSPFGYHQYVRPHAVGWLVWSVTFYDALFLGVFSVSLLTLLEDVQRRTTRTLAMGYIVTFGAIAVVLFARHVVERAGPDRGSLALAAVALAAPLWLAAVDHVASWRTVFPPDADAGDTVEDPRVFAGALAAAVYLWAVYAGLTFARTAGAPGGWPWLGAGRSLIAHLTVWSAVSWLLVFAAGVARLCRRARALTYLLLVAALAAWLFAFMQRTVLPALALTGLTSSSISAAFAITVAATWSGLAVRNAASGVPAASGLDVFLRAPVPGAHRGLALAWLLVLPFVACATTLQFGGATAGLLFHKVVVLVTWLYAWCAMTALARGARWPSRKTALAFAVLILTFYQEVPRLAEAQADPTRRLFLIDRYAALDASFRTLNDALASRPVTPPAFFTYLEANSNVRPEVVIAPTSIDFAPRVTPTLTRPPDIFLFVIDSLRPDYLSAYNPAVTFSPQIGALARESLVFRHAFSRYGGTGLAVPSIWSGGLLPHRQYVTPFDAMNPLLKLLQANHYRVMASLDSIMTRLLPRPPELTELGADSWTARDDACQVFADLRHALSRTPDDRTPVFAYTLPQNVHLSYVQGRPILNESYPGFYSLLAARVHQVDTCLGAFISELKAIGRYDDSVIIVTADHGDSIGEGGRWGHGFAGFPEVFRIPLIVHLPPRLAAEWTADLDAVSFSTDIVPTLYRLLGQPAAGKGTNFGLSLVHPTSSEPPPDRRRASFLLGASYGPVYGMLQQNGERLYVVDAVNSLEYAYDLAAAPAGVPVWPGTAERVANQRLIQDRLDEIAAFFHFDAQPVP